MATRNLQKGSFCKRGDVKRLEEGLHDFSPKGREAFAQSAGRLRTMLRDGARQVTQQGQADTTSAEHVAEAYRLLIARSPSRLAEKIKQLGVEGSVSQVPRDE